MRTPKADTSAVAPIDSPFAAKPLPRGYTASEATRSRIAEAHRTKPGRTVTAALADQATVLLCPVGAALIWHRVDLAAGLPAAAAAAAVIGRQLRALECLVHEACHFNWYRRRRRVNDLLGQVHAGLPTGSGVCGYRASHLNHHTRFGTGQDPDRVRYLTLGLERMRRTTVAAFAWDVVRLLPRYQVDRLRTFETGPLRSAAMLMFQSAAVAALAGAIQGRSAAVIAAVVSLLGQTAALPAIRLIGESSEHVYSGAESVFEATVSNLGRWQRLLIHPHNDGYHTIHHLWPGVPHHELRRLHRYLMAADRTGYADRLLVRTGLLRVPLPNCSALGCAADEGMT